MSFDANYNAYPNPPGDPASFAAYPPGQGAPGANYAGLLQALAQANDFTMEDLQANRRGWLTQQQQATLAPKGVGCAIFILVITVASTIGGGGVGVLASLGALNGFSALVLVFVALALIALGSRYFITNARKQRNQLRDARVAFIDGFVERERHEYTDSDGFTHTSFSYVAYQPQQYAVNQQRFSVSGSAFHALVPGLRYRVYYVPTSNKLASIEPLP